MHERSGIDMANPANFAVGDKVQIRSGGIDVTNGSTASQGRMYGENGPLWATVESITNNWNTGGKISGVPNIVTKVRCVNNGIVVWQVQPEDIASNVIKSSQPELVVTEPETSTTSSDATANGKDSKTGYTANQVPKAKPEPTSIGKSDLNRPAPNSGDNAVQSSTIHVSYGAYVPIKDQIQWTSSDNDAKSIHTQTGIRPDTDKIQTVTGSDPGWNSHGRPTYLNPTASSDATAKERSKISEQKAAIARGGWRDLTAEEKRNIGNISGLQFDESASHGARWKTIVEDPAKKRVLQNLDAENIQNSYGFPVREKGGMKAYGETSLDTQKYDYRINLDDYTPKGQETLESKLMKARAAFGIQTHGSHQIARSMKFFTYNRYKSPDTNLLYNRSKTYIFFTRPDLNLLTHYASGASDVTANQQTLQHTDTALLWQQYPELFKLLTDSSRCADTNNFNMLLSNQVNSLNLEDDTLDTITAGKSWRGFEMAYGKHYTGKMGGQISCGFLETSEYSIINLMKLWITYIDNVSHGAWSPSYNLFRKGPDDPIVNTETFNASHVYTRSLDYAASLFVFKTGPDGETVKFWRKYYGIFPLNSGTDALSYSDRGEDGAPQLNIQFRYCSKKDLSPVSLLEFNSIANISESVQSEDIFNKSYGHVSRPFVGVPYIELDMNYGQDFKPFEQDAVDHSVKSGKVRLKFKPIQNPLLSDSILYSSNSARNLILNQ